jgi:hypothetical protein
MLIVKAPVPPSIDSFIASPGAMTLGDTTILNVTATGGTGTLYFDYVGLPSGCSTLNVTHLPCNPSITGTFVIRVYVNDSFNDSATATTPLTVNPAPAITSFVATPSTVLTGNIAYLNVTASGGTGWLSYAFAGLPNGCLTSNVSSLACIPTVIGNYTLRAYANDSTGASANLSTTLDVRGMIAITALSASPNPVTIDHTTLINVTAVGGTGTLGYDYVGLPAGCSSTNTVSLACAPSASGTFHVRVFVNDTAGHSSSSAITLTVNPASVPTITAFVATPNPVGVNHQTHLNVTVSGGTGALKYVYTGLPQGCSTDSTASLACTPWAAGTFIVRVFVNDTASHSASGTTTLTVNPSSVPTISAFTATPNPVVVRTATYLSVTASGGSGALHYTFTGLPSGCSTANVASLSCTPTTAGKFTVRVFANDTAGHSATSALSLTVNSNIFPLTVVVSANLTQLCIVGTVTLTALASGGQPAYTYLWSLNSTNTSITSRVWNETITHAGNYTFRVWVKDGGGAVAVSSTVLVTAFSNRTTPPSSVGSSSFGGSFGILLLVIVALIVAVVVAVVWMRRRRGARQVPAAGGTTPAMAEVEGTNSPTKGEVPEPGAPPLPSQPEWDESKET